jgi:hypothetical protein
MLGFIFIYIKLFQNPSKGPQVILGGTEQLIIYLGQLGLCAIQVRNGVTLLVFERAHHIFNMRLLVLVQYHEVVATAALRTFGALVLERAHHSQQASQRLMGHQPLPREWADSHESVLLHFLPILEIE